MGLLCWDVFPLYHLWWGRFRCEWALNFVECLFCIYDHELIMWFLSFLCWYIALHWLICICWTIFVFLELTLFKHGILKKKVRSGGKETDMSYSFPKSPLERFFFLWPCPSACGILVPWPGMEPIPSTLEAWSLNHWTAREVPRKILLWVKCIEWSTMLDPENSLVPWLCHSQATPTWANYIILQNLSFFVSKMGLLKDQLCRVAVWVQCGVKIHTRVCLKVSPGELAS